MDEIKVLKQNERQKIILCSVDGKKVLKREIAEDKREIYKTLQKVRHSSVPGIFSVEFDGETIVYEEFSEGKTLASIMEEGKIFTKKEIRKIFLDLADALVALHTVGIIHRDIKPDNILIDENGNLKLIDYDIARIYRSEIRKDTEKMGTFGYAPIEQYGMLPTDFKTDIYAMGVTITELLKMSGVKGYLYKICEKCKRLDPSQRYESAKAVKRTIFLNRFLKSVVPIALLLLGALLCFLLLPEKEVYNETFSTEPTEAETLLYLSPTEAVTQEPPTESSKVQKPTNVTKAEKKEEIVFEEKEHFKGFAPDAGELQYKKFPNYNNVAIFSMYESWDHLLFLADGNKKGKIRMGNNAVIDADITLADGKLRVYLKDKSGNEFQHEFAFEGQYEYPQTNPPDRKNADFICCDMDLDGEAELMVGLNEGCIGVVEERYFYNNFNYCIAWCIDYDETDGFILCEGDMFTTDYSFHMMASSRIFSVNWNQWGDITGYFVEDGKIIPLY